jgi:hypothetical protein
MRPDALNGVCPYYTMYPLDFPLRVLKEHRKRGVWVIDPFCGRGTTNFAARLLGMPSIGVDSSPVAAALAKAKLASAEPGRVVANAKAILNAAKEPTSIPYLASSGGSRTTTTRSGSSVNSAKHCSASVPPQRASY